MLNSHYCLFFLSFLPLFLNSLFSAEYCFLINKFCIEVFTASAAAANTSFSMDKLPCNFWSSCSPPGISLSANRIGSCSTDSELFLPKPDITLTRTTDEVTDFFKFETPMTIHSKSDVKDVPKLVGTKASSLIETTCQKQNIKKHKGKKVFHLTRVTSRSLKVEYIKSC